MTRVFSFAAVRSLWKAWSCVSGVALLIVMAWGVGQILILSKPVSTHANQILLTPKVKPGGQFEYQFSVDRHRTCLGHVTDVFQQTDKKGDGINRAQIVMERVIVSSAVGYIPQLRVSLTLPSLITPGLWHFTSSLVSRCPGWLWDERRVDLIAELDFVVEP